MQNEKRTHGAYSIHGSSMQPLAVRTYGLNRRYAFQAAVPCADCPLTKVGEHNSPALDQFFLVTDTASEAASVAYRLKGLREVGKGRPFATAGYK